MDKVLDFIRFEKPDILAVQEAYNGTNTELEPRFRTLDVIEQAGNFAHYLFSPTCMATVAGGLQVEAGNAIFSHFPITHSRSVFYDVPFGDVLNYEAPGGDYSQTPRNLQHAVVQIGNTGLNVFNTQGIWSKQSEDTPRHKQMSEAIMREMQGKTPTLLAGDFNLRPASQSMQHIEQYMRNVFANKLQTTMNYKHKNPALAHIFQSLVVDMIYASPDIKVMDAYCPDVDISDHFPLVCVIDI
jgi:endonuclease/exonuclease/phosphatase family metal-dependent hydrolase